MAAPVMVVLLAAGAGQRASAHQSKSQASTALHAAVAPSGIPVGQNSLVALEQAAKTGREVIIADQTTKTTTVYANPNGTLTSTIAGGPVQEPDSSSPTGFSPIDLSLAQNLAGLQPTRADAPIMFSDGGDQTVASLGVGEHALAVQWGSKLPVPTVKGKTATYTGVASGVNLVLIAQPDGFDLQIVLTKKPAAAQVFHLPLNLTGLTASVTASGQLQFTSAAGKTAAMADAPQMWGAATDATGEPSAVSTVPVAVSGGALTVSPAQSFLTASSTTYPVTIDPAPNLTATADTYVDQAHPTGTFDSNTEVKAGLQASGQVQRALLQFDTSSLSGTDVLSASLNMWETFAGSCSPTQVDVYDLSAAWTTSTNWNTQPSKNQMWASASTDAGFNTTTCAANWVTFSTGGTGGNTLQQLVQDWANGTPPTGGVPNNLEVVAHSETSNSSYKRFDSLDAGTNQPDLAVTYNSFPTAVTAKWPENAQYVNNLQPSIHGDFQDPDGGTGQVQFEVDNNATGTNVVTALGTQTSVGGESIYTIPSGDLSDGVTYKWRARGYDGTDYGAWSGYRTFTEDVSAPTSPSLSSSTDPSSTSWYTSQSFTVSMSSSDTGGSGVAGYIVSVNQHANTTANGSMQTAATYSGTVPSNGVWYVHVAAEDNAGNVSSTSTYQLNIGAGAVLTPLEGDQTGTTFNLEAVAPSGVTSVKFQYRRSPNDSWVQIPPADVTDGGMGIGSWPVNLTGTPPTSHILVWNAQNSLGNGVDGGLEIRANFTSGGGSTSDAVDVLYDTASQDQASSAGGATAPLGPGSVDLVTGDFNLSASDADVGGMSVDRSFDSLAPDSTPNGVFGPGWSSSLDLGTYVKLHNGGDASQGNFVTIYGGDGSELAFWLNGSGAGYVHTVGAQGYALSSSGSGSSRTWTLTDPGGTVTIFGLPTSAPTGSPDYYPTSVTPPNTASSNPPTMDFSYSVVTVPGGSQTRPTQEVTARPGVACASAPLTTAGCQTLTFTYATSTTATGTSQSQWGDFQGELKATTYTAYDPTSSAMNTVTVEDYQYDSNGRLRAEYDPRLSTPLETTYDYDSAHRVMTVSPPGVNAWTINYNSTNQVTTTVRNNDPSGTETTTVIYGVPLYGSGAPYTMGAPSGSTNPVTTWAQQDYPANATAIFPATEVPSGNPPSDYTQATVYYTDANGQLVNVAQPGGEISTTEYDQNGNVVRTLSPLNRQTALAVGSNSAAVATSLDTQNIYSTDGTELLEMLGPQHLIMLDNGTTTPARQDTTNTYGVTSTYGQGLLTQTVEGALEPGASSDVQTRTTTYQYSAQSNIGLTLGEPTSQTTDPSGLDIVHTTKYDVDGNVIATITPGNPSGGDAHEIDTTYYRAGTGSGVGTCDSTPQNAGMVCQTAPAAQPTGGLPSIPTTTYTYDMYGDTLVRTDTSNTTTRIWTHSYDNAGRLHTTAVSGPGTSVGTVTQNYDTSTGLPSTTADGTSTVTHTYDDLGRLKTYEDASGNTSTYTYDALDQVASVDDGKGTQTYTYQSTGDERDLLTKIVDSATGTFTGSYDANGDLTVEQFPNGIDQCTSYDPTSAVVERTYQSGGSCGASGTTTLIDYTASTSIHNQWLASAGPSSTGNAASETYAYDAAGRLLQAQDTLGDQCTTRQYGYDADSNRAQFVSTGPGSGGACQTGTLATVHSYDASDRLTDSGVTYDAMGRVTTLPAADAGGTQQTIAYYSNDRVNTITQGSTTHTATLDPVWRVNSWATSADATATETSHYADDSDSPAWVSENTAGSSWTRNIEGVDGLLSAVQASGGSITYELTNLHGDIGATADGGGTILSTYDYQEFGAPRSGVTGRYGWVGSYQREGDITTGDLLMGSRIYEPTLGRFLQVDPVTGGSANSYDYTNQDPINESDTSGDRPYGYGCTDRWFLWDDVIPTHYVACTVALNQEYTIRLARHWILGDIQSWIVDLISTRVSKIYKGALKVLDAASFGWGFYQALSEEVTHHDCATITLAWETKFFPQGQVFTGGLTLGETLEGEEEEKVPC
ncbi:MAG TPA: DNRLRE domain-containing protein [Gaiellales bacterium]|nr:DNRLRE domain-containing protein [Gaiellales bacterium]